jgi:formylglycine-generating enzyme required for sulfatase activity
MARPALPAATLVVAAVLSAHAIARVADAPATAMVRIPAGTYLPLYTPPPDPNRTDTRVARRTPTRQRRAVAAFDMDVYPVTNAQYLAFVRDHPEWRRSRVQRLFADDAYLRHWRGDLELGDEAPASSPVVNVSWFAARAYLRALGKQLPTVDQWEYAAAASERQRDASRDPAFLERLRVWYARPAAARLPAVGSTFRNVYGVSDLHGLIWEWTLDFNSALVSGESRANSDVDRALYCGGAAAGAADFENYAAFMRYAFRSSLEARYDVGTLGFRGAKTIADRTSR